MRLTTLFTAIGIVTTCGISTVLVYKLYTMAGPVSRMPAVFIGHGSPMSALEMTKYSKAWARLGNELPRPKAIVCISAHWETAGTRVTSNAKPKTIHDFYGFPKSLYEMQYPAPGDPSLAQRVASLTGAQPDDSWGLDHGSWTVLKHMYPEADIPVIQLSLDRQKTAKQHFELGQKLAALRDEGILIMGSGNVVHNLQQLDRSGVRAAHNWARNVDSSVRDSIQAGDYDSVVAFGSKGPDFDLAINSGEHMLPLLYILGAASHDDKVRVLSNDVVMGSLSMTTYVFEAQAAEQ